MRLLLEKENCHQAHFLCILSSPCISCVSFHLKNKKHRDYMYLHEM